MGKVLGAKRVLCHSLLLDVTSKSILVQEPVPVTERVLWTLDRKIRREVNSWVRM
jgi:hypothetical protein